MPYCYVCCCFFFRKSNSKESDSDDESENVELRKMERQLEGNYYHILLIIPLQCFKIFSAQNNK